MEKIEARNGDDVTSDVVITEQDYQQFLDEKFSKGAFAGTESIKAISQMYNVNILTVNELGPAYWVSIQTTIRQYLLHIVWPRTQLNVEIFTTVSPRLMLIRCAIFLARNHAKRIDLLENSTSIELE